MSKTVFPSNQFKRDLKKHYLTLIDPDWTIVLNCLLNDQPLPEKYKDHLLTGNFKDFRDCHIKPDLVLIYAQNGGDLILHRLGTHSELF